MRLIMILLLALLPLLSNTTLSYELKEKRDLTSIDSIVRIKSIERDELSECYQFSLRAFECYESEWWSDCQSWRERSELADEKKAPLEKNVSYSFWLYLPHDYPEIGVKQILGQWHNDVDGPTLSQRFLNGKMWLDLMLGPNVTYKKFPIENFKIGSWNKFEYQIKWSESGKILGFLNGEEFVNYSGDTLGFHQKGFGPYFRFGIYRSHLYRLRFAKDATQRAYYCSYKRNF